jgi:hypothetical protein
VGCNPPQEARRWARIMATSFEDGLMLFRRREWLTSQLYRALGGLGGFSVYASDSPS